MRKTRRDYHQEANREPFELDLTNPVEGAPTFVTFLDPNKIPGESAFSIGRSQDAEEVIRSLLSPEDYPAWWAEWRKAPIDEIKALLDDVREYYGVDPKEQPR